MTSAWSADDSVAVTVTDEPSVTGFGAADSDTEGVDGGVVVSVIVTSTEPGLPAVTDDGRVPSATVNVSSSRSSSAAVVIVPVPVVEPALIVMDDSDP